MCLSCRAELLFVLAYVEFSNISGVFSWVHINIIQKGVAEKIKKKTCDNFCNIQFFQFSMIFILKWADMIYGATLHI
jgi:hypothetical protein